VDIEFDPKKNTENLRKHGLALSDADGVLNDPMAMTLEDETSEGEARFVTLGMSVFAELLVVVWTQRGDRIRLISARKAVPKERRAYEEGV
jgi:uncharacterized DUF497 family protein